MSTRNRGPALAGSADRRRPRSSPPGSRSRGGCRPAVRRAAAAAPVALERTRRFWLCPESWRRYYLCGERSAPTGAMFLGRQRRRRDHALLPADPRARRAAVARPGQGRLLGWLEGRRRGRARAARDRVGGRPARGPRVQARPRRDRADLQASSSRGSASRSRCSDGSSTRSAPGLEWSVLCYLDLETVRPDADGDEVPLVVDYKVKTTPLTEYEGRPATSSRRCTSPGAGSRATRRAVRVRPDRESRAPGAGR